MGGMRPTAITPWWSRNPTSSASTRSGATKAAIISALAVSAGCRAWSHAGVSSNESTGSGLSISRRTTCPPSATKIPWCSCSAGRRIVR